MQLLLGGGAEGGKGERGGPKGGIQGKAGKAGKADGKGKDKGDGKGKGKTLAGADGGCKCCGNLKHTKKLCWYKDTACLNCHKIGHRKNVCHAGQQDVGYQPPPVVQPGHARPAPAEKTKWKCDTCLITNSDVNIRKCEDKKCPGISPKDYKDVVTGGKPVLSKSTVAAIDHANPEKGKPERDKTMKDIVELKASIESNKKFKLPTGPMEARMAEMEASLKVVDNTPAMKGILGDRSREKQNHEARLTKLEEALQGVQDSQVNASDREPEEMEEEKARHIKAMAELEEMYCQLKKRLGEKSADLVAKIKLEKEAYAKRKEEIDIAFAKEAGGDIVTAAAAENVITAAEATQAQYTEGDCIYNKLQLESDKLEVAQQMTEEQLKRQAAMMKEMIIEVKEDLMKTIRKEIRAEVVADAEDEENKETFEVTDADKDGFQNATGRNRNRPQRTRPRGMEDAIVDDSSERVGPTKRAGGDVSKDDEEARKKQDVSWTASEEQFHMAQDAAYAAGAQHRQQQQQQQGAAVSTTAVQYQVGAQLQEGGPAQQGGVTA